MIKMPQTLIEFTLRCNIVDITRWNWRGQIKTMHSKYYDTRE